MLGIPCTTNSASKQKELICASSEVFYEHYSHFHIIVIIVHIIIIIIIIATAVVDFGSWPFCQFQLNDAADFFW